jgi:hypothetical protein
VLACLALPFTVGLIVRCTFNIITDTVAIVFTSIDIDAQIDENEKVKRLIDLLVTYGTNCDLNYDQIQTYYNTIETELQAYKNSTDPTARVAHSTIVANTNVLLINLISENC